LKLGKGLMDHRRFHDLLKGILVLELRIRVIFGMEMVDAANLGEIFEF
jgi:hypothetical protein